MSEGCGNPHCITHGDGARVKKLRDAKGRVAANAELMSVVRMIASNADASMTAAILGEPDAAAKMMQMAIIKGEYDSYPAVQGVMNAFAVLLLSHRPAQEFYAHTLELPEEQGFLATAQREVAEANKNKPKPTFSGIEIPGVGRAMSLDDFLAMLKGGFG